MEAENKQNTFPVWKENQRDKVICEIADVINKNSIENHSNTPDFILAEYLVKCLENFTGTSRYREQWYGRNLEPNQTENILNRPVKHNLIDVFKELKFGRTGASQSYLDKCIKELYSEEPKA